MENTTTESNGQATIIEEQPLKVDTKKNRNTRSYKSEYQRLQLKYWRLQIVAWCLAGGLILSIAFILTSGVY